MFLIDMLIALIIALVLTGLFALLFRRMTLGGEVLLFFLILFLSTWGVGLWIVPFGPTLFAVTWLPYLLIGLLFALLLTIFIPPVRSTRMVEQTGTKTNTIIAMDLFFWILILGLLATIVIAYL